MAREGLLQLPGETGGQADGEGGHQGNGSGLVQDRNS